VPIQYEAGWDSEPVWTHWGRDKTLEPEVGSKFNALQLSSRVCQNGRKLENYSIQY